mmetsp:Transcript_65547/g.128653  ORF Transcript_65547/g.128653 Transcript_65547/m.128653 type:complete len:80 (-) Transcript_65547:13-252(-)
MVYHALGIHSSGGICAALPPSSFNRRAAAMASALSLRVLLRRGPTPSRVPTPLLPPLVGPLPPRTPVKEYRPPPPLRAP